MPKIGRPTAASLGEGGVAMPPIETMAHSDRRSEPFGAGLDACGRLELQIPEMLVENACLEEVTTCLPLPYFDVRIGRLE